MKKIVITQPMGLTDDQLAELKKVGDVTYYDTICKDTAEWLERVKGADVIYSNNYGLDDGWRELRSTYITIPFVGFGWLDIDVLRKNGVLVSNSPGCNQIAVTEWIIASLINYSRRLPDYIRTAKIDGPIPPKTQSIHGKSVCIIGNGTIGSRVGKALEVLGMRVDYYTRRDNLEDKIKNVDFIVDCIALNDETKSFYNEDFFAKAKDGVVFMAISPNATQDFDAIYKNLGSGKIKHFISDNGTSLIFNVEDKTYKELLTHPNITVTPHVAAYSAVTLQTAARMCIENIKAYLSGSPINLIYKP